MKIRDHILPVIFAASVGTAVGYTVDAGVMRTHATDPVPAVPQKERMREVENYFIHNLSIYEDTATGRMYLFNYYGGIIELAPLPEKPAP